MKSKLEKELLETLWKDPSNWRGTFYFNKRDPRLMVPKLYPSLGWTVNFACPYSYIALGAIAIAIILIELFS